MTKALLAICIAVSLGAAVLGYLNRDALVAAKNELQTTKDQLASKQREADEAKKEVEAKKEEVAKISSEKEQLNTELGEAKGNLDKAKQELAAETEKATGLASELETAKSDIKAKDEKIAQLESVTPATDGATAGANPSDSGADTKALQTELDETKTLLVAAQDRNTGLEAQISEYRRKEEARQKSQMRQGIQGTILAVNQAWNFVVLSIGDRQGVVNNAEMLIQRGSQLIGKVRVTSVEPSTAIADVIVRTVPRGFSVMPGDTVIYPGQKN